MRQWQKSGSDEEAIELANTIWGIISQIDKPEMIYAKIRVLP
jgi:hypothetical protein